MIETANADISTAIKSTWRKNALPEEQRYIEYFFRNVYRPEYGYAEMDDTKALACVCRIPHVIMLNDRALRVSQLCGISQLPEKRKEESLRHLMEVVIDACEHTELLTIAAADESLKQYGFEPVYTQTEYTLTREYVKRITNFGCAFDPSPLDMLKVYSSYIRRFNGFLAREVEDFVRLKREVAARGGKIVAFYNEKKQIQGYAVIHLHSTEAFIEECVYLNSLALAKLANAALQERMTVYLRVSDAEDMHIVFPGVPVRSYDQMMVRLNDAELLSRLFNAEIHTAADAYRLIAKPLRLCIKV